MGNALLMTGLLILAALAGGVIGSACARKRDAPEVEGRIADLEDRLDALADHVMEQAHAIRERVAECELLIGETPDEGLLGRVGALEDARRKEGPKLADLAACVDAQGEKLELLQGKHELFVGGASLELEGLRMAVEKLEGDAHG